MYRLTAGLVIGTNSLADEVRTAIADLPVQVQFEQREIGVWEDFAEKLDPNFAITFMYKGQVNLATNQFAAAVTQFQHALALDSSLAPARQGLAVAQQRLNGR